MGTTRLFSYGAILLVFITIAVVPSYRPSGAVLGFRPSSIAIGNGAPTGSRCGDLGPAKCKWHQSTNNKMKGGIPLVPFSASSKTASPSQLLLMTSDGIDDALDNDADSPEMDQPENKEEKNFLERINSFLDTPILDANNFERQGPVAEFLKDFVRSSPEVAQVVFSVVVIAILVGLVRLVTSF